MIPRRSLTTDSKGNFIDYVTIVKTETLSFLLAKSDITKPTLISVWSTLLTTGEWFWWYTFWTIKRRSQNTAMQQIFLLIHLSFKELDVPKDKVRTLVNGKFTKIFIATLRNLLLETRKTVKDSRPSLQILGHICRQRWSFLKGIF